MVGRPTTAGTFKSSLLPNAVSCPVLWAARDEVRQASGVVRQSAEEGGHEDDLLEKESFAGQRELVFRLLGNFGFGQQVSLDGMGWTGGGHDGMTVRFRTCPVWSSHYMHGLLHSSSLS